MTIKLILRKDEYFLEKNLSLKQALKELGLLPESYLAMRNGEVLTEDQILREGDVINLIAVISGG
jgi:sulfur carrier protein ThiS